MTIALGVGIFLVGFIIGYVAFEFRLLNRMDDVVIEAKKALPIIHEARDDIGVTSEAIMGLLKSLDILTEKVTMLADQNNELRREKLGRDLEREKLKQKVTADPYSA